MPPTSSWYALSTPEASLTQGDIILDCPVASWVGAPVEVSKEADLGEQLLANVELMAADLLVMTQACDLEHSHVETVILCPHHSLAEYRRLWETKMRTQLHNPTPKAWRRHCDDIKDGFVWNLVLLNAGDVEGVRIEHRVANFHYIYSVPRAFIETLLRDRGSPRLRLVSPYLESVSQSFARYFMRIGLPTPIERIWA